MRRFLSLAVVSSFALGLGPPLGARAAAPAAKIPLDYKAYDSWNLIRGIKVSDDGKWLAYSLTPEDGDPVLVVRDLDSGKETREERGTSPIFTADSKFVVYTIRAKNDDIKKAEREHKPAAEQPKSGLGILDLEYGKTTTYERVKSAKVAPDANPRLHTVVAFAFEAPTPSPRPSAAGSGSGSGAASAPPVASANVPVAVSSAGPGETIPRRPPAAVPSGLPANQRVPLTAPVGTSPPELGPSPGPSLPAAAASPSASASPDDLHKIEEGTDFVIRDLNSGAEFRTKSVGEYAISHDGEWVAFATQSAKDKSANRLSLRRTGDGHSMSVKNGEGHYRNLTFAPKHSLFSFESDVESFGGKAPHYDIWSSDLVSGPRGTSTADAGIVIATVGAVMTTLPPGLPTGWAPSVNAPLSYSRDGHRLFFGTAPAPTPVPSGTPEPMKVDIWSWTDNDLQPMQRINADTERKRSYSAVVAAFSTKGHPGLEPTDGGPAAGRLIQLGTAAMRDVRHNENPEVAIGSDDRAYRKAISWTGRDASDLYAVSLHDGARRLLQRGASSYWSFSPDGKYVVNYDPAKRAWYSLRASDGRRTDLTSALRVPFYDEQDEHPRPPEPYGMDGFTDDGRYALVRDRYDIWAVELASGKAWMLTQGLGRRNHLRFYALQLDAERQGFSTTKPVLLQVLDDGNKWSGWYVARFDGPAASRMRKVYMAAKWSSNFVKARNTDRLVLTQQSDREPQDIWATSALDGAPAKVSDANPQRAKYVWMRSQLISYTCANGKPMRGILLTSDDFNAGVKHPMLVYFYERYSDTLFHPPLATIPSPSTGPNLLRYVSNGYVALIPDITYTDGHPGKSALGCVMPAVDAVVRRGFVDPKRIGISGHSWGAYQTAYIITQTHRFAAAEAGATVADMISAYGGIRWGSGLVREFQYEHDQSRIGATPWDRLDLYVENSPLFWIKNITTPYLTIANDNDDAVPWQQGIEFITALRRLGKPAWMFEFDGEYHNLRGREAQKYWTVHMDEFFDHYLAGKPEPGWMKQGVDYLHRGTRDIRPLYGEPTSFASPVPR